MPAPALARPCAARVAPLQARRAVAIPRRSPVAAAARAGDDAVDAMVRAARRKMIAEDAGAPSPIPVTPAPSSTPRGPLADFATRARAAWRVLFPARAKPAAALSPKEAGKQRLRMILVADRCGMAAASLSDMKAAVVRVLADYVEVDGGEDLVEVNVSNDADLGTVYSVAVPVRRVKPSARTMGDGRGDGAGAGARGPGGAEVAISWEALAEEADKDPAARFPYGV